jgi:DNA-binding YbaB/EbfC family protein
MPDFMKILQQAQEMSGRFQKIQDELEQVTLTGTAGGGMVSVEVTGTSKIKKIKLDPSVVNPADVEMLEDLIVVAVSDAQQKAQTAAQERMGGLMGGLGIPNLPFKLPFG